MEPPAKRLRILQSVEVDETNPDYIAAKQKQQQKFKGRLESLFAKYESMHESMSDEIDFTTGKVVVDRGHLRRVQRQMQRKEPTLLDSLLLEPEIEEDDTSEREDERPDSEDELAPTQAPRKDRDVEARPKAAQPPDQYHAQVAMSPFQTTPVGRLFQGTALHAPNTPNTPNPAVSLLQYLQFPQTPIVQQAQAAISSNLEPNLVKAVEEVVNRALQQAVLPLINSVFSTTPGLHPAQALVSTIPSPHVPTTDNVRPAIDPKWYFPPMSNAKDAPQLLQRQPSQPAINKSMSDIETRVEASSPLAPRRRSPKVCIQRIIKKSDRLQNPTTYPRSDPTSAREDSLPALSNNHDSSFDASPRTDELSSLKRRKSRRLSCKYQFSEDDDIYIFEKRVLHKVPWVTIRASKKRWSSWPLTAFYNRWNNHIKGKQPDLRDSPKTRHSVQLGSPTPTELEVQFFSSKEIPETSSASHRLPTPSSLEQNDAHVERAVIPSSSHFDDDELELLSLPGADVGLDLPILEDSEDDEAYPTPDEILPSIEGADFRNEDELQLEMLKYEESGDETWRPRKDIPSTIPETQDSLVIVSSPSQKRGTAQKSKPKPAHTDSAMSDSDDDLDLIGADDRPTTPHVDIKRESLTPQASKLLCSSPVAFKTPVATSQLSRIVSSDAKSTGKLSRRAYLQEVKQSWTKRTPGSKGLQKRRSLNMQPTARKRAWADVGDSDDELAG